MPRSLIHAPLLAGLCLAAHAGLALADPGGASCAACNDKIACPPKFIHYYEDGPKLKFKRGCPRPVCDPCNLEHFGYYRPCWSPWPYPPDWSHCNHPTPSQMLPPPRIPPYTPRVPVASPEHESERRPSPSLPRPRAEDPELNPKRPPVIPDLPEPKKMEDASSVIRIRR